MTILADRLAIITAPAPASAMRRPACCARHGARLIVSGRRQAELSALLEIGGNGDRT